MSDSKKKPNIPPPDDFSKTTPNVDFDEEFDSTGDWRDTHGGDASEAPADDWGKTVINYDVSSHEKDTGDLMDSANEGDPSEPDWGVTQANVNLNDDFESTDPDFADHSDDGATVPYFRLPDAERAKYQNIPDTPTEKAKKEEQKQRKEGGVPMWFWVSAGLMTMFSFAVLVLLGAWFFFTGQTSFTVRAKGAQPFSQFFIDGNRWGVPRPDDTVDLPGLRPGKRQIIVRQKGFKDFEREVKGDSGETVEIIVSQIKEDPECVKVDLTNVRERERCADIILSNLDNPPNLDDLLRALNLYYINFDSGRHDIPPSRQKFLERASTYIKQLPETVQIEIGGHTDNVGGDNDNLKLSERRANSVRQFFIGKGVKESMLVTKGYGESSPKESNATAAGRFQNRRIQYTAIKR